MGRKMRLEVAADITKQEMVSQSTRERLTFAEQITGYLNILLQNTGYRETAEQVLALAGRFYQADRAYLFERDARDADAWNNTYEWCAKNVQPQKENLQRIPCGQMERWLELFARGETVVIHNMAPLRTNSPVEWEILHHQDIQRVLAVPIRENGNTVGFVGVDNPRVCIRDDSQLQVLAGFLLLRMRQERCESRSRLLLRESGQDILRAMEVGLWDIRLYKNGRPSQMDADEWMDHILGVHGSGVTPEERFQYWRSRVLPRSEDALLRSEQEMRESGRLSQVEFGWRHPQLGELCLRFTGILTRDSQQDTLLRGYCRVLDSPD